MKFVDVHIHLSDEEYSESLDEIVQDANNANVVALVSNSMDLRTNFRSLELAEQFRGTVYASLGIHPSAVNDMANSELEQALDLITKQSQNEAMVAIGEIGLDSKYSKIWDKQMKVFDSMLHIGEKLGLQVIVHSRGTTAQIMDMLPSYKVKKVLLHWFSNPTGALSKAIQTGSYISEGVPTVFSNGVRDTLRRVPLEDLLTETDGPVRFFRPPFEGKRTTPAFIPIVVRAMAELRGIDAESFSERIAENFQDFFGIKLN
jgi:TatD DNase family protein